MWSKGDLVAEALTEIGLAGHQFDATPEELQGALRRLDSMMATWEARGVACGYALPSSPDGSNATDPSGLPDTANEAVYLGLAIRIAPSYGKAVSVDTRVAARNAYELLLLKPAQPQTQQFPAMPGGAGNRGYQRLPYLPEPDRSPLTEGAGESLAILPE
jgi:hypothetical protein